MPRGAAGPHVPWPGPVGEIVGRHVAEGQRGSGGGRGQGGGQQCGEGGACSVWGGGQGVAPLLDSHDVQVGWGRARHSVWFMKGV